jgi:TRAP-type mannitol/chloroaromatic compound transport system permease large subunit
MLAFNYTSVFPYTLLELTGLAIIMVFPQIALWLPNLFL